MINFTKTGNKYVSEEITITSGTGLHVSQVTTGSIQVYAKALGMPWKTVAQTVSSNEIFELGLPTGTIIKIVTRYEPQAVIIE